MASSKSGLISPRCGTRGRVARGSSSGTRPILRGPADPPPASFGHTSCASSGTAPSGSTVLTIQSAVEEMHLKCLVGYCLRYIAKRYLSRYRVLVRDQKLFHFYSMYHARLKQLFYMHTDFTCIRIVPMHGFMTKSDYSCTVTMHVQKIQKIAPLPIVSTSVAR